MADRVNDEYLREIHMNAVTFDTVRAIAAELLAARERIAKLEQEPPMAMIDFGYGLDLKSIRDDLKLLDDVRRENRQLRAEVERLREDGNTTAMDLVDERDAARADLREAMELLDMAEAPPDHENGGYLEIWNHRRAVLRGVVEKRKETP